VIVIRYLRVKKFRKKNKGLSTKIFLIWFLFIFSAINLPTKSTNALFTSQTSNTSTIKAKATWWDRSSLSFTNQFGGDCNEIYTYIQNNGQGNMQAPTKYYVYFDPANDPVDAQGVKGKLVYQTGTIPKLAANDLPIKLNYKPQQTGNYQFVAFQQSNKPASNGTDIQIEENPVTFSEIINIQCPN
jgi:YqxM protein